MALLKPQQRMLLAQHLRKRANTESKLSARKKKELYRKAFNLVQANSIEAGLKGMARIQHPTIT